MLGRNREEKVTWPVQFVEVLTVLALHGSLLTVLHPIPFVYMHIKRTEKEDRVDIGTPGGCGLGDKIPKCSCYIVA